MSTSSVGFMLATILITSTLLPAFAQTSPLSIFNTYVSDSSGNILTDPNHNILNNAKCNQQVIITTNVKNTDSADRQFKLDYGIYASATGNAVHTQTQASSVPSEQTSGPSISWTASDADTYKIQITLLDDADNKLDSSTTIVNVICDVVKAKNKQSTERVLPTVNKKEKMLSDNTSPDSKKQISKVDAIVIKQQSLTRIKELINKLRTMATDEQKPILDELEKEIAHARQTPNTSFGEKAKTVKDDIKSKTQPEKSKKVTKDKHSTDSHAEKKVKDIKDSGSGNIAIDEPGVH